MKRKIKIDNLFTQDTLAIFGRDWISTAMDLDKYENQLISLIVDDPVDFEIELEVEEYVSDVMLRVSQQFYIPVQMEIILENDTTYIELNRLADSIY